MSSTEGHNDQKSYLLKLKTLEEEAEVHSGEGSTLLKQD